MALTLFRIILNNETMRVSNNEIKRRAGLQMLGPA